MRSPSGGQGGQGARGGQRLSADSAPLTPVSRGLFPFPSEAGPALLTSPLLSGPDRSFPNGCPGFCLCAPHSEAHRAARSIRSSDRSCPPPLPGLASPTHAGLPGANGWPRPGLKLRCARLSSALLSPSGWLSIPTPLCGPGCCLQRTCSTQTPASVSPSVERACGRTQGRGEGRRARPPGSSSRDGPEPAQSPGTRPLTGCVSLVAAIQAKVVLLLVPVPLLEPGEQEAKAV